MLARLLDLYDRAPDVGDDFGSWLEYRVEFACGHTLAQMQASVRMAEYI